MLSVKIVCRLPIRRLCACVSSVYQALPPTLRAPGNEAILLVISSINQTILATYSSLQPVTPSQVNPWNEWTIMASSRKFCIVLISSWDHQKQSQTVCVQSISYWAVKNPSYNTIVLSTKLLCTILCDNNQSYGNACLLRGIGLGLWLWGYIMAKLTPTLWQVKKLEVIVLCCYHWLWYL